MWLFGKLESRIKAIEKEVFRIKYLGFVWPEIESDLYEAKKLDLEVSLKQLEWRIRSLEYHLQGEDGDC